MYLTNKKNLYIFCLFWDISRWRICFIHFILKDFREGGGGGAGGRGAEGGCVVVSAIFFADLLKGLWRRCISWGFPLWGIGWNYCILSSACHHLLYLLVSLLSAYLFIYYYFYFLVGVNSTHPFLLMWAIVNLC